MEDSKVHSNMGNDSQKLEPWSSLHDWQASQQARVFLPVFTFRVIGFVDLLNFRDFLRLLSFLLLSLNEIPLEFPVLSFSLK